MKRLNFLRNKFNVIPDEEYEQLLKEKGVIPQHTSLEDLKGRHAKYYASPEEIVYPEATFEKIIGADPTKNQMYVQWLMNILNSKVEVGRDLDANNTANIFLTEDLPKTRENLELYEGNKRKKRFKEMCAKNYALRNVDDATNINQYHSLDELFAAVYPFKPVVDMSDLEKQMEYFVSIGEAELPVKDEAYTVFIPKTLRASELFSFTNWCTGTKGNTMFKHYTTNNKKPDGNPSDLYIVIDNGFLRGENENIYQIHFETGQIMDKKDVVYKNLRYDILDKNISVRNFFYDTLYNFVKTSYNKEKGEDGAYMFGKNGSCYVKYSLQFGFGEILFDVMPDDTPTLSFIECSIDQLPNLSRFKKVKTLYFDQVQLTSLNETFFTSPEVTMVSIPRNKISKLPESIGNCKKLVFMNLKGNPIGYVPDTIKYLDPSRGGLLEKIAIDTENKDVIAKLKKLLPNVVID